MNATQDEIHAVKALVPDLGQGQAHLDEPIPAAPDDFLAGVEVGLS
jgi:hypothetical protein